MRVRRSHSSDCGSVVSKVWRKSHPNPGISLRRYIAANKSKTGSKVRSVKSTDHAAQVRKFTRSSMREYVIRSPAHTGSFRCRHLKIRQRKRITPEPLVIQCYPQPAAIGGRNVP
jgi:hypothetical protein